MNFFKNTETPEETKPPEVDFMRFLTGLRAELAHSLGGVLLRGARPVPIGISAEATPYVSTSAGRLVGWSVTETTGAGTASVKLYDGNGGLLIASLPLTAGQSRTDSLTPGLGVVRGIYAVVTGSVEGTVWVGETD